MLPHKVAVNMILVLIISSTGESYRHLKAGGKYVQSKQKRFALMEIFAQEDAVHGERVLLGGAVVVIRMVVVAIITWMECAVQTIGDANHHIVVSGLATNLGEFSAPKM
ncbi:unnamed protein product [Porites evermanni]|uniref:Uncharacterized protein n=1 Tax=Porites evermanni TaxID=104178 RepID=A0ABN8LSW0_9CNID|nr:unnamed protein product [Porites evermanni]